jgi:SAM-dependent methyltransferase
VSRAKALLKPLVGGGVGLVPQRVMRPLFRLWLDSIERWSDPRQALRELLEVEAELDDRINHTAIRYDGGVHPKHRLTRYHDFFVERIRRRERVLDLGCGKGELAADIAERAGATVVGVDRYAEYLRFARERFRDPRLTFVEADIVEYDPPEPFDVVVLSNVLEHVAGRVALLRRIVERARPSRILIRVPVLARDWLVPMREELGLWHFSDPTHETEYDPEGFEREMRAAGLDVVFLRVVWSEIWAEVRP